MEEGRSENLMRRLHSLSGVLPLGIFLCCHMAINYSATWGVVPYNLACLFMSQLLPFKEVLELVVIFIPLTFHAVYGVYIALRSGYNAGSYNYASNWRFVFQRITGIIAFVFVIWHVYGTRFQVFFGAEPDFDMIATIMSNPAGFAFFMIGVLCVIYHFVNGLWTFCISWGLLVSERSQRVAKYIMVVLLIAFAIFGARAVLAFV